MFNEKAKVLIDNQTYNMKIVRDVRKVRGFNLCGIVNEQI